MYKRIIRPIFFLFDPESIHHFTFQLIGWLCKIPGVKSLNRKLYCVRDSRLQRKVFDLTFANPVGLAAGFDKDALRIDELSTYGFGFIEIGTVTPISQKGNLRPRLFRLPADQAIINRMGFNNRGVEAAKIRLMNRRSNVIIGGNIGKNKATPNQHAVSEYLLCFETLYETVDYFVINVSSPNTPNLRALQEKGPLMELLQAIRKKNLSMPAQKPVLLKIAPDLTDGQLTDIVYILKETGTDGVIATNTTIDRSGLSTPEEIVQEMGAGGLSGKPVGNRSTEVIRFLRKHLGPGYPIIGVGGIMTPQDAQEKMEAGATLIQVYTGFIYEGPRFVKEINQYLAERL